MTHRLLPLVAATTLLACGTSGVTPSSDAGAAPDGGAATPADAATPGDAATDGPPSAPPPTWSVESLPPARSIAVGFDATGIYLTVIETTSPSTSGRLERRLLATGAVDPSFAGGAARVTEGSLVMLPDAVHVGQVRFAKTDGAPIAGAPKCAGHVGNADSYYVGGGMVTGGTQAWRILRYDARTCQIMSGFNVAGDYPNTIGRSRVGGLALDGEDLFATGEGGSGGVSYGWRTQRRHATTGAVLWSHEGTDFANGVAIVPTARAVFVLAASGNDGWQVTKLDRATGRPIPEFGGGAPVAVKIDGSLQPASLQVDDGGVYVAGPQAERFGDGGFRRGLRVEKRDPTTGALVPSFGEGGTLLVGTGEENVMDAAAVFVDATSLYVVAGRAPNALVPRTPFLQRRRKDTGAL